MASESCAVYVPVSAPVVVKGTVTFVPAQYDVGVIVPVVIVAVPTVTVLFV